MDFADELSEHLRARSDWARDLLCRLITFRSTTGAEAGVQEYLSGVLSDLGFPVRRAPVDEAIVDDPDYTSVPGHKGYAGRPNVLVNIAGSGGGRSAIVNTHTDVVPGPDAVFEARCEAGIVHGRGACDAKGQAVTLILALSALKERGVRLKGDVEAQFVIEEEAGGSRSSRVSGPRARTGSRSRALPSPCTRAWRPAGWSD
jgi:acetylornithine deacetylase